MDRTAKQTTASVASLFLFSLDQDFFSCSKLPALLILPSDLLGGHIHHVRYDLPNYTTPLPFPFPYLEQNLRDGEDSTRSSCSKWFSFCMWRE